MATKHYTRETMPKRYLSTHMVTEYRHNWDRSATTEIVTYCDTAREADTVAQYARDSHDSVCRIDTLTEYEARQLIHD